MPARLERLVVAQVMLLLLLYLDCSTVKPSRYMWCPSRLSWDKYNLFFPCLGDSAVFTAHLAREGEWLTDKAHGHLQKRLKEHILSIIHALMYCTRSLFVSSLIITVPSVGNARWPFAYQLQCIWSSYSSYASLLIPYPC